MTSEEIIETIQTYSKYLEKLIVSLEHLCDDLAESDFQFISPVIPAGMEGLAWVDEAAANFVLLQLLDISVYDEFKEHLGNLKNALEANNYVLYYELLSNRLLPVLRNLSVGESV